MKYAKGYNKKKVESYVTSVNRLLDKQPQCTCYVSCSTYADIYGRYVCNTCGKTKESARTITVPYWFYEQK